MAFEASEPIVSEDVVEEEDDDEVVDNNGSEEDDSDVSVADVVCNCKADSSCDSSDVGVSSGQKPDSEGMSICRRVSPSSSPEGSM